jgi:hypothetical protein
MDILTNMAIRRMCRARLSFGIKLDSGQFRQMDSPPGREENFWKTCSFFSYFVILTNKDVPKALQYYTYNLCFSLLPVIVPQYIHNFEDFDSKHDLSDNDVNMILLCKYDGYPYDSPSTD